MKRERNAKATNTAKSQLKVVRQMYPIHAVL